eukprot:152766-Pyramimonas_sp.AAC.1
MASQSDPHQLGRVHSKWADQSDAGSAGIFSRRTNQIIPTRCSRESKSRICPCPCIALHDTVRVVRVSKGLIGPS